MIKNTETLKATNFMALGFLSAALFGVVSTTAFAQSVSIPASQLKFEPTGISDGVHPELKAATAYGDRTKGEHSTIIKIPSGFVSPPHTHTSDYWGVVISGVVANGKTGSTDIPLPAGSYFFQKGGEVHLTKCIDPQGCTFILAQDAKYDFVPAK